MSDLIESKLIAIASTFLNTSAASLNLDSGPGDVPRWDSFAQVGLVAEIEAQFDLSFDIEEITMFETLRDIHDALRARLGAPVEIGEA